MASSRRAILIAGLTATAGQRSWRQSDSRRHIPGPIWGAQVWRWCARCRARSRQREALSGLDDHLLEDIGVTRQQANAEAAKPFWK
jgi:uncharacterized protein YjiS (DUF1127 family)